MRVVVECVVDDFVFSYSCVVCFGIYLNIFGTTYKRRWRHMSCTLLRIFCSSIACIPPTFSSVRRSRTVFLVCCGTVYSLYVLRILPSACHPSAALAWFSGCCKEQSVGNLPTFYLPCIPCIGRVFFPRFPGSPYILNLLQTSFSACFLAADFASFQTRCWSALS